ncbi:4-hydroxy-3-methylbut-2-en-1-yl diphosphate synthase [Candidatus Aerophobetes bacterium]|uniref:4-hydroxy-3-methylbut-2-en-1-yl diphosphate synthase (flavodoxin) n=1 Tax=Aerophobetes bacterium TaxID=2030807 RepID=A0A662D8Z8_UNCAE|nr:MAG: 4-hydroxy-3-methylbut-2-en-1-yl diphosphate synthase [Candidatus Aerophobetes bacterium]
MRKSKIVEVRGVKIGGGLPPVVQGMVKTDPLDIDATVDQIEKLQRAGAKLVRLAVPNVKVARSISVIRDLVNIPLSADIHFNYRLALEVIDRGIDKVRINPGNLSPREISIIADKAKKSKVPIRVGVNSGSLPKKVLEEISRIREDKQRRHRLMVEAMVDSALGCIRVLEDKGFEDIVVSLKASDVSVTILANKIMAEKINYPLHLGVTATGPPPEGIIKSAIGLGSLLCEGIGDTIRVSLTADPIEEIKVAYQILKYLGFVDMGPTIISCPTCGRKRGDVYSIVKQISKEVGKITSPLKIAVMGCEVNGPGEAIEADIGVACTTGGAVIFKKGRLLNKIRKEQIVPTLLKELRSMDHNLKGT